MNMKIDIYVDLDKHNGIWKGNFPYNNTPITLPIADIWGIYTTDLIVPIRICGSCITIIYNGDVFIAINISICTNVVAYSKDGTSWNISKLPKMAYWGDIAYGDNKFIIISHNSDSAAYSKDGINWYPIILPADLNWYEIIFGNNMFVAINYCGVVACSKDGTTWNTNHSLPCSGCYQIEYGNGKYVIITTGSKLLVSEDCEHWQTIDNLPRSLNVLDNLVFDDNKFIINNENDMILCSVDGYNWEISTILKGE